MHLSIYAYIVRIYEYNDDTDDNNYFIIRITNERTDFKKLKPPPPPRVHKYPIYCIRVNAKAFGHFI